MFNGFMNQEVLIMVATRTENLLEYRGVLSEENEKTIKLKDATINIALLNFQKNIFGSGTGVYQDNIAEVVINKSYIISCNKI